MTDLAYLTVAEGAAASARQEAFAGGMDQGAARPDRGDRFQHYNAFLVVTADKALAQAKAAEAEIAKGQWRGPMHGVPYAAKDIFDIEGMATTCHSKIRKDHRATSDAFVVKKLREAGAVLLGKVALHEFATGGPAFDLPWPPARNPWNRDLHPGGSSSGSGAALAAGMAPAALGTDTGGSVRNPATCCGIVGMKPTYGAVSLSGVFPLTHSLDHVGPMTRTVEDNAILFHAIAGHDPDDPTTRETRDAGLPEGLEGGAEGPPHRRHRAFLQGGRRSRSRSGARHRPGGRHAAKARRQRENHPAVAAGAVDRLQPHHPPGRGLCHPRDATCRSGRRISRR